MGGTTLRVKVDIGKLSQESATTFIDGTQKIKYWAPDTTENLTATMSVTASRAGFQKTDAKISLKISKNVKPVAINNGIAINWRNYPAYIAVTVIFVALNIILLLASWRLKRRLRK
jgi:hypothetical protein